MFLQYQRFTILPPGGISGDCPPRGWSTLTTGSGNTFFSLVINSTTMTMSWETRVEEGLASYIWTVFSTVLKHLSLITRKPRTSSFYSPKNEDYLNRLRRLIENFVLMLGCRRSNILFQSQFYCLLLQGRYYLSAETLKDMKNWVLKIRTAIRNLNKLKDARASIVESGPSSINNRMEAAGSSNEPEYASIKDYPR